MIHVDAQFLAVAPVIIEPLRPVMSETVVVAYLETFHVQLLLQDLCHKVTG